MNIYEGSIDEALYVQALIPEFESAYPKEEYLKRLKDTPHLILIAAAGGKLIGCKVGYAIDAHIFYSWMGGVRPAYRGMHVAKNLADCQEGWARSAGYQVVRFKTRNYLKPMLCFGLKNGFDVVEVIKRDDPAQNRIVLEKKLN